MNDNGLPCSNTTEDSSVSLNCILSDEQSYTHFAVGQQHGEGLIHTTSMSNGAVLYSPVEMQQVNGFTGNAILRQIIANDVHHPNTMSMKNIDARNMVIKKAPHGAVQITYRKMIHSLPEYKTPIRILPKPTTCDTSSPCIGHKTYVTSSKTIEVIDSNPVKELISQSVNKENSRSFGSSHLNHATSTHSTHPPIASCNKGVPTFRTADGLNSPCAPLHTNPIKSINGSSKNLNINLPRIEKPSLLPAMQLDATTDMISMENSVYTNSINDINSCLIDGEKSMYTTSYIDGNSSNVMNGTNSIYTTSFNGYNVSNSMNCEKMISATSYNGDNHTDISSRSEDPNISSFNGDLSHLMDVGKAMYTISSKGGSESAEMNGEQMEYINSIDESDDLNFSSSNDQFDGTYDMGSVSEFISSSQSIGPLTNSDLGMDLLSMDLDSLDPVVTMQQTMVTSIQNESLFDPELQRNISTIQSTEVGSDKNMSHSSCLNGASGINNNSYIDIHSNAKRDQPAYIDVDLNMDASKCDIWKKSNLKIQPEIIQSNENSNCNYHTEDNFLISGNEEEFLERLDQTGYDKCIDIIDVSPDTSTTLGGCKIILIGSWNAKNARYSCKFGMHKVKAELIQNGVLRCYSPKHKAGKIKLCVMCEDEVISNEVDFLVVNPSDSSEEKSIKHIGWMSITNKSLVLLLVERIIAIAEIIGVEGFSNLKEICEDVDCSDSEERILCICKQLMNEKVNFEFDYHIENTMTVLHLAAALGFIKLIQLLLNWVETNPNKLITVEASPTQYDQFSLLPIMWSSAKGHFNTTCVLHQWVESTIDQYDACGCTAIDLAKECGHEPLAEYLVRLQKKSNATKESKVKVDGSDQLPVFPSVGSYSHPTESVEQIIVNSGCAARTLGKTLARIQSMISHQDEDSHLQELNLDGEECLFEASPFTPRQTLKSEEINVPMSCHSPLSTSSPLLPRQSPFNRQAFQTAEFCEFFYKAKKIEKDFAELTLTDEEQQDLLRAANVIQSAYKTYKERRKRREQEFSAAVLIQSYYRRYKQYAAFKKMQKGAVLIQNQYRAHREKSKKKMKAAIVIQAYYRRYRERKLGSHEDVHTKNKLQRQADRKINRYLKQTSTRFTKEFPDAFINGSTCSTSPVPS